MLRKLRPHRTPCPDRRTAARPSNSRELGESSDPTPVWVVPAFYTEPAVWGTSPHNHPGVLFHLPASRRRPLRRQQWLDFPDGAPPVLYDSVQRLRGTLTFTAAPTPEPSTWAMPLLGFAGLGFVGYQRSRRAASTFARSSVWIGERTGARLGRRFWCDPTPCGRRR
jgi:hypothetical protein